MSLEWIMQLVGVSALLGAFAFVSSTALPSDLSFRALVIDLEGDGLHLSDLTYPVTLNLDGTDRTLTWTSTGQREAFVWLDRTGDNRPQSGEILGAGVLHGPAIVPGSGFGDLQSLDRNATTGNGDGVLDRNDPVWSLLRLWVDFDHDAVASADELSTLKHWRIRALFTKPEIQNHLDGGLNLHASWAEVKRSKKLHGEPPRTYRITEVYFRLLKPPSAEPLVAAETPRP